MWLTSTAVSAQSVQNLTNGTTCDTLPFLQGQTLKCVMLWLNEHSPITGDYRSEEVAPRSVVRNLRFILRQPVFSIGIGQVW